MITKQYFFWQIWIIKKDQRTIGKVSLKYFKKYIIKYTKNNKVGITKNVHDFDTIVYVSKQLKKINFNKPFQCFPLFFFLLTINTYNVINCLS